MLNDKSNIIIIEGPQGATKIKKRIIENPRNIDI